MKRGICAVILALLSVGLVAQNTAAGYAGHGSDLRPPYGLLIFGVFSLFLAVVGTCTGAAWARSGRVVYRAKEPKQFWSLVAMYYLGGLCFVGYFLYKAMT
jgi:hypothetical protein